MVQWLGLHASNAGDMGLIPGWGTKTPKVLQPKKKRKKEKREQNRLTDIENRLVVAKGEGVGGRMEWSGRLGLADVSYYA